MSRLLRLPVASLTPYRREAFAVKWSELDRPLKLTVLAGIMGGILGLAYYPVFLLGVGVLPVVPIIPLYSLCVSLCILLILMSSERRGILAFTVALASTVA